MTRSRKYPVWGKVYDGPKAVMDKKKKVSGKDRDVSNSQKRFSILVQVTS